MAAEHAPIPLFDTLEYLDTPTSIQTLNIEQHFSGKTLPDGATTDYKHACNFLYTYRGSPETFKSYRRELERLLQWSWFIHTKSLKNLRRIDFEAFLEFCQAPPKHWIGIKHVARFIDKDGQRITNPEWRPFVASISKKAHRDGKLPSAKAYTLSQSTLQAIFAILSSFYNYLEQEEYTTVNPVAQIRQKSKFLRKHQSKRQIRRLSELQWAYIIETAELMAKDNSELHERTLFIMNALYAMYLRISELAATNRWIPQMGHFYKDMDSNWWALLQKYIF